MKTSARTDRGPGGVTVLLHPAVYPSVRSCVSVTMINRRGSCGFCPSFC